MLKSALFYFLLAFGTIGLARGQETLRQSSGQVDLYPTAKKTVFGLRDTVKMNFIADSSIYKEGWDTLAQIKFWRNVITLTSDTCIINVAYCRKTG
jgi:hypothetical protein